MASGAAGEGLEKLEAVLGHRFARRALLKQALTHRSLAHEAEHAAAHEGKLQDPNPALTAVDADNEQLEFLGDAVIGFLTADDLCKRYPELDEGQLTRLRAGLVSRQHLGEVASRLNLGASMLLGRGEDRSGGRKKNALLANCLEAVVAALYLDGGLDATREFLVREVIEPWVDTMREQLVEGIGIGDHKSALQEFLQAQKLGQPEYVVKAESGPDHRKRFLVEVYAANGGPQPQVLARGVGNTKKKAEQEAARRAMPRLKRESSTGSASEPVEPS
jgi:ribonuclease-3